jgi:DNA (cytosine-5)-methyltransferase 1
MKVLDLFSGIGGFSIGLEKAGFETVAFCEIEEYPRGVLKRHWPDIPIYRDVRELTGEQLRADGIIPDVIVGGYPCQPFSLAGVRRGEEDDRHLWPEVRRLINEIRPAWGIFENVAGHITMGLDEVLSDLEAEGYAARPFVIPACSVDAPHRRDRVWIVAHANRSSDRRTSRQDEEADGEVSQRDDSGVSDKSSEVCSAALGNAEHDGSPSSRDFGFIQGKSIGSEKKVKQSSRPSERAKDVGDAKCSRRSGFNGRRSGKKSSDRCEDVAEASSKRLQGRTEGQVHGVGNISKQSTRGGEDRREFWPTEPNVGRVANGVPARSHRIKALGNAVVPQIPEIIGRMIMVYQKSIDT